MGGRYLVTGVQLGMIKAVCDDAGKRVIDEIIEHQYVFESINRILEDVENTRETEKRLRK